MRATDGFFKICGAFGVLLTFIGLTPAQASTQAGITYQGRILKPDNSPLQGANVQFKIQIRTPNASNCLMFEEIQALDMRNSNGLFALTINDGTGTRTDTSTYGLDRIFANNGSFTFDPSTCSSGSTYSPGEDDGRRLSVLFKDETMSAWEPMPAQSINFVPFAFESKQVQGFPATSLLRVQDSGVFGNFSPLSNAQYTELMALVNGTSVQYSKSSQLGGASLPTMNSGDVLGWNGTTWVSTTAATGANSVSSTMLQTSSVTTNAIANNVSISTSGTLAAATTTTRDFKIFAASPSNYAIDMQAPALSSSYSLVWPVNAGTSNQVLTTDGSGNLSWATPATSSQWTTGGANISYSSGSVGIGTTSPRGLLDISGTLSSAPSANTGAFLSLSTPTLSDNSTAASGTATGAIFHSMAQPVLTAGNTSVTTTNSATLELGGAPLAGTNETLTSTSALYIPVAGVVGVGTTAVNAYGINASAPTGATNNYAGYFAATATQAAGVSNYALFSNGRLQVAAPYAGGVFIGSGSLFSVATKDYLNGGAYLFDTLTAASGTVANESISQFGQSRISTSNTGITYTNAATVYIAGPTVPGANAPTMKTSVGLMIDSGGLTAPAGTITNGFGLYVKAPTISGGATMTNSYAATFMNGNVGIGTTSPGATLDIAGQFRTSGTTPTISSCGTSPTISGTDQSGKITMGSGALASCTVSFHATLTNAPASCVLFPANATAAATGTTAAYISSISTSSWVVTGSNLTSAAYWYHCF